MDTKTITAADLRAGDVVVEEDGFTLNRLEVLGDVERRNGVVTAKARDEDGEAVAQWDANYELEVERKAPKTDLAVGDRVKLTVPVERFPHFKVEAGATGEVVVCSDELLAVKMDEPIDGAETWENEILWTPEDVLGGADLDSEVEAIGEVVDLGAGGTVEAKSFAVEVELVNGKTEILPFRTSKYEHAERKVGRIERGIERGDYDLWRQAYVVTADGTEV